MTWVRSAWSVRALQLLVMLGWLALVGDLTWLDRFWYDTTVRLSAPFRRPVHNRILNLDVQAEDLKNWGGPTGEYNGVASLIAGLRKQGARVIVLDLMFPSGTPKDFGPLWKQLGHKNDEVVLGRTGDEETLLPPKMKKKPAMGLMLLDSDSDGVLRRYRYARQENGTALPSLALAAYLKQLRSSWRSEYLLPNGWVEFPDVSPDGDAVTRYLPAETLIDLRADWSEKSARNFGHFTPRELQEWNKKPGPPRLAGAIVFVGYVAAGAMDRGATALNASTPKVSLHAAALNDLMQDSWRSVAPRPLHLALATFLTLAAWWLGSLTGRRFAGAVASLTLLLQLGCLLLLFRSHWVPAALSLTVVWWLCLGFEKGRQALLRSQRLLALQSAANAQDPLVLKTVGEYQLVERIGQGGFASVYRALPTSTLDPAAAVAVKIVHPSSAESEDFRRRFSREIRISMQLCHPAIVRVFDWGDEDGMLYLVMELLRGRSLRKVMDERETWDLESTTIVIRQILQAMAYAHQLNVLHRDLKPENVMVGMDLSVKVVDFGLAFDDQSSKLTKSNDLLGTLGYLAPERIQGTGDDHRSDQYAVGVMAYEMLAGRSPFTQESTGEALLFRLTQDPAGLETFREDLSERLVGVITRMMAREVGQRFPTTAEALAAWDVATENVGKS